jgi:hypothetical protein
MPAESVQARAVITRPAPRPATAGLAPLAGHVLFPPGQAARRHSDGGTAIAHHHARQRMQVRSNGPRARDLGPAHRHGRPSLASPRAVSAGRSRLIRTVSPGLRHSGRPRPPGTDLADYQGSKQATDLLDRLICVEFPDLHGLRLDRNQANARADRRLGERSRWPCPWHGVTWFRRRTLRWPDWCGLSRVSCVKMFQWLARAGMNGSVPWSWMRRAPKRR